MTKDVGGLVGWSVCQYKDLLEYLQPTKYIVESTNYNDSYKTPVLTAGKSFIKGYTDEVEGVFDDLPVIIFDDFTTASKYVNFTFKVKSSAMKILVPSCKLVNLKFVFHCMQNDRIRSDTHKRYWISVYSIKELNLPPLAEQNRIVDKIEQLFSELDKGIENLKKSCEQLKIYRQAVLKHAFEGKLTELWRKDNNDKLETADQLLTCVQKEREERYQQQLNDWKKAVKIWESDGKERKKPAKPRRVKELQVFSNDEISLLPVLPEKWDWVKIDKICEHNQYAIKAGPFGSALKKEYYVADGYKVYGQEQVISGDHEIGDYYVDDEKYKELSSCTVKPFDVLISLVGTVGKVLVLPEDSKEGIINPRLIKISINSNAYFPEFFKYYFESAFLKSLYKLETHGATMDVLNLGIIQTLPFPLCDKKEQLQLVNEIESKLSVIEDQEEDIKNNLSRAETLRLSILKKAFSGQLIEQDPNDEPVAVLLERIKAEKEKQKKSVPKKKTNKKKTKKRKIAA